ncbi:TPA: YSIRK-type signal peptide-containing protein, partial [Streptococcus suis]
MSNRDKNMFRQEQRFSFRKYSFGLASALIANVVFGATIAGGPVVHADTETEVAAVSSSSSQQSEVESTDAGTSIPTETVAAPVERQVALTYTVKVVDKAGTVLKTEVKTVDVTAGEGLAFIIAELGEELVPADYKLVDGLGQVRVVENQENIFTVTVEKEVAEKVSENTSAATASSETAEVVAASETAVAPAPVKVIETTSTNTGGLASLALLAYEVHYTDSEGQVVGKTAGLMTAESKDGVATKEVTFSASDVPAGYELAEGQSASLTKQLVENQVNILSFAVVKKSKEEEIAASQLANKTVLEQVTSEADLLADEALRQVATTQAGNTALETAAKATKEVATETQAVLKDASATQEVVDSQVETVKASTKALADEMLKVDEDGNITAQLSIESSNGVFQNAKNTTYIVADSQNLSTATEHIKVSQAVSGDIQAGQTSTWTVFYNAGNPSTGYGHQLTRGATHKFAIGNEVVGDIRIEVYQRSDANAAWTLVDNTTHREWTSSDRQYYAHKALLADFKQMIDNNGQSTNAELTTLHNIGSSDPAEAYHTFSRAFGHNTRQYKFVVTAKIKAGRDARNVAFLAGNDSGSTRNRYYSATPAKVDPVTISNIAAGQSSVTIKPQELAERIEVKVKNQNVVLERQANGTYNATTNAANVTVNTNLATGAYTPTITLTLPNGTTFAEGDKVRAQSSIADASQINGSGLKSEQLISSEQKRQYSTIVETTIPRTPNQPTTASNPQRIYVFKNTAIKTVANGTANPDNRDSVSIGTITDPDGIRSMTAIGGGALGYTLNNAGEATGTPSVDAGFYSRAVDVTDNKGVVTRVFQNSASTGDQRYHTYILDTTTNTEDTRVVLTQGQTLESRAADIVGKVIVNSGNGSSNVEAANAKKYRKVIVPGQSLSAAGGPQTIMVRVITASNVYKDVPVYITAPPANQAPTVTINSTETNVDVDGARNQAIYVFGLSGTTTEDINGATGTSPVADPAKATRKVAEMADTDGTISTVAYHDTSNPRFDLASATDPNTNNPNDALLVDNNGYLTGYLIYGPGAKSTRRLDVTDNGGATTSSSTFKVLGYTDKVADPNSPVEKVNGIKPTAEEIFAKMAIDVNSRYTSAVPSTLVIPADQYRREIVGYRTAAGQPTTTVTSADELPETGDYEVRVKTTNIYGQEIFNWVRVDHDNNQLPTISQIGTESGRLYSNNETNKYLFVFGKTEGTTETETGATTAAPAVNKANAKPDATIVMTDPDGSIASIAYDDLSST